LHPAPRAGTMIALVLDGSSLREVTVSIFSSSSTATKISNPTGGVLTVIGVLAGFSLFTTGCYAELETRPAVVTYSASARVQPVVVQDEEEVYGEAAPVVEIETYPSVVYAGRPVYWVDGRWYYRGPRGWAYYRSEPRVLVTQRVDLERRYPERFRVRAQVNSHVNSHVNVHTNTHESPTVTTHRDVEAAHPTVKVHESVKVKESVKVQEKADAGGSVHVGGSVGGSVKTTTKTTTKTSTKSSSKDRR
jgi:hypothetical protein